MFPLEGDLSILAGVSVVLLQPGWSTGTRYIREAPVTKFRHSQQDVLDFDLESIYACQQSKMTGTDASGTQKIFTE